MSYKLRQIRETFVKEINPLMTGSQIGTLSAMVNNIVFDKKVDPEFLRFALDYFIKYKPGKLHQPAGLHYIIQNKDVIAAWNKENERKLREQINTMKAQQQIDDNMDDNPNAFIYKPQKQFGFDDILGG